MTDLNSSWHQFRWRDLRLTATTQGLWSRNRPYAKIRKTNRTEASICETAEFFTRKAGLLYFVRKKAILLFSIVCNYYSKLVFWVSFCYHLRPGRKGSSGRWNASLPLQKLQMPFVPLSESMHRDTKSWKTLNDWTNSFVCEIFSG